MPSSVRDFWSTLVRLRVVDSATAQQLVAQVAASTSDADDPVKVAKLLIAQQVLTKYQAKRILADRGDELVQGDYVILDRAETPLSRWYRARMPGSAAEVMIYPCSSAPDSRSPVDLAWLAPHSAVAADGLQTIDVFELAAENPAGGTPWRGLVISQLPLGQPLSQWLASSGPVGFANAFALGEVVGGALSAMHNASLFHGGVRPGRVWIADDSSVYLLRTASGPPVFPGAAVTPVYEWFDDDGQAAAFAAPQWLAGASHADARSDVYSLGAVIFNAATGQSVVSGELPPLIAEAVAAGATGDPVMRVLGATLAPDPAQRFPDVPSFLRAIAAVQPMINALPPIPSSAPVATSAVTEAVVTPPTNADPVVATSTQESRSASRAAAQIPTPSGDRPTKPVETPKSASVPAATTKDPKSASTDSPAKPAKRTSAPPPVAAAETSPGVSSATAAAATAAATSNNRAVEAQQPAASLQPAESQQPEQPQRRLRKRTRRNNRGPVIIGSTAVGVLLLLVAILLRSGDQPAPPKPRPTLRPANSVATQSTTPSVPVAASTGGPTPSATVDGFEIVRDDRLLWVPPWAADTAAPPLDLVVPGAQALVSLRPQSLLNQNSQADWLAWFGQDLSPSLAALAKRTGVPAENIERLVIGLVAGTDGEPEASLAVWLAEPQDLKALREKWNVSASKTPDGATIFAGDEAGSDAYFVAGDAVTDMTSVKAFAVGRLDLIRLIAEGGGGPIPLSRPMQTAWDQASDQAQTVVMVSPNFLFADGRKLLQRFAPRAIEPLKQLLIPDVTAVVLTIDTSQNWYVEIGLLPGGGSTAAGLARAIEDRAAELPTLAENFVINAEVSPSWRAMAIRLPQYLRAVKDQTRFGISETLATANFYLPASAAPQVTLASLLAMSTTPQAVAVAVTTTPTPKSMTIEEMLNFNLSISFEQESLEFAVGMIGDEFSTGLPEGVPRPKITIIGGDLEKSGITQNQQVRDFKMRDIPLREVLTKMVAGANPDKTVTKMTEEKQSLVWVVDPASTDAAPSLLITTRPQAAVKGYKLPKEFVGE